MNSIGSVRRSAPMWLVAAAGLPGALTGVASGQTLTWQNAAGGAASTAGNWSPSQVPSAANALVWNLASTYGVTFGASTGASLGHTYRRGAVTLTMTSPHAVGASGIVVGDLNGDNATTTLSGGALSSAGSIVIGDAAGSIGRLSVSGSSADLSTTGAGRLIVGNDGNGTLTVSNLGSVVVADRLFVGDGATSVSSVVISGGQTVPPFAHSTLTVTGTGESRLGSAGGGAMSVLSGGAASFAGDLTLAALPGSTSSLIIDGTALPISSVSVGGNLNVGRNAVRVTPAGVAAVRVRGAGRLSVAGTINLENDPDGGEGSIIVEGSGARVDCRSILIGNNGNLLIDLGEVHVTGGLFQSGAFAVGGSTLLESAAVVLKDAATFDSSVTSIGTAGWGEFRLESGSVMLADSVATAVASGTRGDVTVTGPGSRITTDQLLLALRGQGSLRVEDGGLVEAGRVTLGGEPGGGGSVELRTGQMAVDETVIVGGNIVNGGFQPGGASFLFVDDQSELAIAGNFYRFGNSSVILAGGRISAAEFHTAVLNFGPAIQARGVIDAKIRGALAPITAIGSLMLGDGTQEAFRDLRIEAGSHLVRCSGAVLPVEVKSATIAGGVLKSSTGFMLGADGTLSGSGRIEGFVRSTGSVTSTGGTLVFADGLLSEFGTMAGERFEFLPASNFRGKPAGARWRAHPGSRLTFLNVSGGPMIVGSAVPDGFVCEGLLSIVHDLIVVDQDGIETGPACTFVNAAMAVETGSPGVRGDVRIKTRDGVRDLLCGQAAIFAGTVRNGGTVSPGNRVGEGVGVVSIDGNYVQSCDGVAGELVIDITGPDLDLVDRFLVHGTMEVDGSIVIRVAPGFVPESGFRMSMVAAGSIVGGIDRVEIPPGWSLERTVQNLSVVFCAPDFNSDGFVDFFDYLEFAACFEGEFCAAGATADFNGDGFVDFFDYDAFVSAFELGC
jgi:T5SS/PEP-CTERM-associated repeat protein